MDIVSIAAFCLLVVCTLIASFMASLVFQMLKERSYWALEKRIKSLENSLAGVSGAEAKQNKSMRLLEAAAKAKPILEGEGELGAKLIKALPLVFEYPDVIGDLLTAAQKKGLLKGGDGDGLLGAML